MGDSVVLFPFLSFDFMYLDKGKTEKLGECPSWILGVESGRPSNQLSGGSVWKTGTRMTTGEPRGDVCFKTPSPLLPPSFPPLIL